MLELLGRLILLFINKQQNNEKFVNKYDLIDIDEQTYPHSFHIDMDNNRFTATRHYLDTDDSISFSMENTNEVCSALYDLVDDMNAIVRKTDCYDQVNIESGLQAYAILKILYLLVKSEMKLQTC